MRANTEVSICISFYVIMMVMSLQITRLFTLFFQHKFNSPLRFYIQSRQYKTRGFKETQAIDRLFVDSFHFLWVSCLSLISFCVSFYIFNTDNSLQTFHTINPFLAANYPTNIMHINDWMCVSMAFIVSSGHSLNSYLL